VTWRLTWPDWAVPAGLAILVTVEALGVRPDGLALGLAIELAACLALVWRRRWTMAACLVTGLCVAATPYAGPEIEELAAPILVMAVAAYSLARWLPDLRGVLVMVAIVLGITSDYAFTDERNHDLTDVFFVSAMFLPPYVGGRIARRLAEQGEQLERQAHLVREAAVRDERDRIAREMHDVIAHSLSAMVVQTAAAQDLLRTDPDRAEEALEAVATTGRRAIDETGRLLHVLRDTDDELGLAPTPGLAEVPELVERFRADGLQVELELTEPLPELPPGVDVSAYRIVQEALTNALRYAAEPVTTLSVDVTRDRLSITSSNRPTGRTGAGSGLGLVGIAERVSLLGGTLSHGIDADGRFRLEASLPVTS
jgi:signal transduction histidine kinase